MDYYVGEVGYDTNWLTEQQLQDKFTTYNNLTEDELYEASEQVGFDIEDFAEWLTGMNLDQYADASCAVLKEVYREELAFGGDTNSLFSYLESAPRGNGYQPYFTFYRALNMQRTKEECEKQWRLDNEDMLQQWVEDGEV